MVAHLLAQLGLNGFEQTSIDNGGLLASQGLSLEDHLADVKPVAKQMGEWTACEGDAPDGFACLESPHLGDNASCAQVRHQQVEAAELEIAAKDVADTVGLGFIDGDLPVLGVVSQWRHAADPQALALGGGDLVPDALGGDLPLELGKRQQHVEGQPPHRGRRVELLRHGDE